MYFLELKLFIVIKKYIYIIIFIFFRLKNTKTQYNTIKKEVFTII